MAYGEFKNLTKRTASDKTFNVAKNRKYDWYQRGLASMVYKFLIKSLLMAQVILLLKETMY